MIRGLKLFLISVVVLFLLVTAISALMPSTVRVSRAIDIKAPPEVILSQVDSLGNWQHWNVFVTSLQGKDLFKDSIISEKLKISIVSADEHQVITNWYDVTKKRTFTGGFNLISHESLTTVQWYFDFHFAWYPWDKFSSMVYDGQVGPPMQESLNNLKTLTEQNP